MRKVRKLPPELVALIAAGEVVESPLSVVKELIENSIDAGATRIDVKVLDGGARLIEVSDNGSGIEPEDLPLVIERYTTSKVSSRGDLSAVRTLGFRGEALYAISRVSLITISSRAKGYEQGYKLVAKGGEVRTIEPLAMPVGTTVRVEDLFYNLPVRRRGLGEPRQENLKIRAFLKRLALVTDAGLSLKIDGRLVFRTYPNEDALSKLYKLFSIPIQECAVIKSDEVLGLSFTGYLALPPFMSREPSELVISVNGRLVSPREVLEAVKIAYQKMFPKAQGYPKGYVSLRLPPEEVDVNIHPRKLEVRFLKPVMVRTFILTTLERELKHYVNQVTDSLNAVKSVRRVRAESSKVIEKPADRRKRVVTSTVNVPGKGKVSHGSGRVRRSSSPEGRSQLKQLKVESWENSLRAHPENSWFTTEFGELIVLIDDVYIAVFSDSLYIIDKHALHEKILFLDYLSQLEGGTISVQRLVIPVFLKLDEDYLRKAIDRRQELSKYGWEYEVREDGVNIYGVPVGIMGILTEENFKAVLNALPGEGIVEVLANLACRAATRAGTKLEHEEALKLWRTFRERENELSRCPHGRPAVVKLDRYALDKLFGR